MNENVTLSLLAETLENLAIEVISEFTSEDYLSMPRIFTNLKAGCEHLVENGKEPPILAQQAIDIYNSVIDKQ